VASSVISLPEANVTVRRQDLKPGFSTEIMWSPGASFSVEGVLPTYLPSTVTSAPWGVDFTVTEEDATVGAAPTTCGFQPTRLLDAEVVALAVHSVDGVN